MVHAGHFGFEGVAWCGLDCGVTVSNSSRFWDLRLLVQAGTCRSEMAEVEQISQFRLSPIYELKASKTVRMDQDPKQTSTSTSQVNSRSVERRDFCTMRDAVMSRTFLFRAKCDLVQALMTAGFALHHDYFVPKDCNDTFWEI